MTRTISPLPMFFRPPLVDAFEFAVTIPSSSYTFYLPLGSGGTYDFTIDWGDSTTPDHITSYNGGDNHHVYTNAGNYTISMVGLCTEWDFANTGDNRHDVTAVTNFADLGFTKFNFDDCDNLTTIANNMSKLTHLTNVNLCFQGCALTTIYADMFAGSPGITNFQEAFDYNPLTSIPADLFKYNVAATDFSYAFYGCTNITAIPANLFQYNVNVTTFYATFYGCTSLDGNAPALWDSFPGATGTTCFTNCTGLDNYSTEIPTSWGGGYTPSFKLEITTTAPSQTFTIPLISGGTYNFVASWGDASPDSTITAYNDSNRIHTYTSAGTYEISLTGTCTQIKFNNGGDKLKVKRLLDVADLGFTNLDFYGCSNLTAVSSKLKNLASLVTAANMFRACSSLATIPAGIFDGSVGILSFSSAFNACDAITTVPNDLFKNNVDVTTFNSTFKDCYNLTTIPTADLFRYNVDVLYFTSAFSNTAITAVPTDFFRYNTLVTDMAHVFDACVYLATVPTDLFRYNTAVTDFSYAFLDNWVLASIPNDFFKYNTAVTTFGSTFNGCRKMQQNPWTFYASGESGTRFFNKTVNFTNCFNRTTFTGTQGTAPDLWNCNFGSGTPTKTTCWGGAGNSVTSLSNYASIPTAWGGPL